MKIGITTSPTIASDSLQKSTMGMSAKGMDIAAYFLRDKIYNDKILACVREYICNAVDEHKKYEIDRPVVVAIKTVKNTKTWSVRDYAKGLDEHGVRNIFGMYFESTKNHSNEYVGGFGIGSKAAHSYTDTFYINSHYNGICSVYACVLGGGDRGVPIGEIFKISEEPTNESGIEISFEVSDSDSYSFRNTTSKFVKNLHHDTKIEFLSDNSETVVPDSPIHSVKLGEYGMHQYKKSHQDYDYNHIYIRMGGVVYKKIPVRFCTFNNENIYVVDVPIGKLSIPISRESIEDTPNNQKVINDIVSHIETFKNEQISKIVPKPLGEYVKSKTSKYFEDDWFTYAMSEYIPETHAALMSIKAYEVAYLNNLEYSNGKLPIYKLPNIKNLKNWKLRLAKHLAGFANYHGFVYIQDESLIDSNSCNVDTSDIEIIDVKKMKLPKLEKNKTLVKYNVFSRYNKLGSFTSEEFEEYVDNKFGEISDSNWHETIDCIDHLYHRTIYHNNEHTNNHSYCVSSKSKKMVDQLHDLGWLHPDSDEYKNAHTRLKNLEEFKRKQRSIEYDLTSTCNAININPTVLKHLKRYPDKIEKIKKIVTNIKAENSTRSRIYNSVSRYGSPLDRRDLRKLLLIKD